MSLTTYKKKRNFKETSEPVGKTGRSGFFRFVVQRHQASHLHYDFRLELGGVLKSWAVPKGPSLNPRQKRLAVQVEDHPVDYIDFTGTIPKGNYGAGTVEIWDNGNFAPVNAAHEKVSSKQAQEMLKKGELKFVLNGDKLKGEFVLVRLKNDDKNWLLIKHKDEYASAQNYDAEKALTKTDSKKQTVSSIRHGKAKKLKSFIHPMLATLSKEPVEGKEWIFEIKWDGYRAVSEIDNGEVKFYSRNGVDFSTRFPALYQSLQKLKKKAVLDGEIVLLNKKGQPDFQMLQHYENNLDSPLIYYVFDLLSLDGKNVKDKTLLERKKLLKKLLGKNSVIKYCDHISENGLSFLEEVKRQGLEGVIAKRADSPYIEKQRSKDWLKIKNVQSSEAVIVGYTAPQGERKYFGSLVLAVKKGKGWEYRGHVGTGFSNALLKELKQAMKPLETAESPFNSEVPVNGDVTWLEPKLVADIAYTEITRDKVFRHPSFLRLRDEKSASDAHEELVDDLTDAAPKDETRQVGTSKVKLSNLHKVFWPEDGFTKGDLIQYYDEMSAFILPHLKDRPLSLKRNPNGIRDDGFYHKDAGENVPAFVDVFKVKSGNNKKIIDYIVCNNKATLLYLANLGCIEMNPWNSTTKKPDEPTWLVIDIDPSAKNKFTQVVDTALAVKEIMDKAKLKSFCKTSGASGLHVYVPLRNKYDYTTVKDFAHLVATLVHEQLPKFTTLERSLSKRGPNIYLDYLQNRSGQTLASVYSVRPVPGAHVSMPLDWKEVNHKLTPDQFHIGNALERVKKKKDIFAPVIKGTNDLSKAIRLLDSIGK